MKWDKVKLKVASGLAHAIEHGAANSYEMILVDLLKSDFKLLKGKTSYEVIKLYADEAAKVVENWDIRRVGNLRELFPELFPPSLLKGDLCAEYDKDGDWAVFVVSQ